MHSLLLPLWPWVTDPSLLLHYYSGTTVATSRLWSVLAVGIMTSTAYRYYRPQLPMAAMVYSSDGPLTSRYSFLLWSIVATGSRRHYAHRY
jgi:hypothetical protein